MVNKNDWISVDYTGTLKDGSTFDSSEGKGPLKFKAGAGMVIKGFDDTVLALKEGEEKTVTIKAEDAYGPRNETVQEIPKSAFDGIDLEEGKEVEMYSNMGQILVKVEKLDKETVKAIVNHPLAGKDLTFKIKVNKVLDKKESEALEKELMQPSCSSCSSDCETCN